MNRSSLLLSALLLASGSAMGAELLAGRDAMPAGTVTVSDNGGTLAVDFDAADPLVIVEAHAASGFIIGDSCFVPLTRSGNPRVGRFEGKEEVGLPGSDPLTVNLEDNYPDGETICIAAHAVVYDSSLVGEDEENLTGCDFDDSDFVTEDEAFDCSEETVWADGMDFPGSNWATWFEFRTGILTCPCWSGYTEEELVIALNIEDWGETPFCFVDENSAFAFEVLLVQDPPAFGLASNNHLSACGLFLEAGSNNVSNVKATDDAEDPLTPEQVSACLAEATLIVPQINACDED